MQNFNKMEISFSAYILAGGKSSRFGENKALYLWQGKPMVQRVADVVSAAIPKIFVVANEQPLYEFIGAPVLTDIIPGLGPLGGVYTALSACSTDYAFLCACDMPHISEAIISFMMEKVADSSADVIIPFDETKNKENAYEPLHAIYSRRCLPAVKQAVEQNKKRIVSFFPQVKVKTISFEELAAVGDPFLAFKNVNTKEDI